MNTTRTTDIAAPGQATGFNNLMRRRVKEILLASSLYDSFILSQDGQLREQVISGFMELNLQHTPGLNWVSAAEALEAIESEPKPDLLICTINVGGMHVVDFVRRVRAAGFESPIVLLTFSDRELRALDTSANIGLFDRIFMWHGDFQIMIAIVKLFEDSWNVAEDTQLMGVQNIILIEDNVKFYSSFLPLFFTEVMKQSQNLISEGVNLYHKLLRMRARPKILHAVNYEEAWDWYERYENHILGIVTDIEFPRDGRKVADAGAIFAREVKARRPDIPILLQSFNPEVAQIAQNIGIEFVQKSSSTLLNEVRDFIQRNFGFGDFVFRMPDGGEIDRAGDLRSLEEKLRTVPAESIRFHAERDHFSTWLRARTEFQLADRLKPHKVSDYATVEDLRSYLVSQLDEFRSERSRGQVADFDPETFDATSNFTRLGGGSLGGKARGLAFMNHLIQNELPDGGIEGVQVTIPPTLVICSDVFEGFLEENNLLDFALHTDDYGAVQRLFQQAQFPQETTKELRLVLGYFDFPLAVRSSSLLEDSQFQPFAGIYDTFMLPNNHPDLDERLGELLSAVKRVYASMFSPQAKSYILSTPYRLEEDKMAVILQKLVGRRFDGRFYPDISGTARSYNFYPSKPMTSRDGAASVALGLGKTVVEGGASLLFCPKYPRHLVQLSSTKGFLDCTQKSFFALDLDERPPDADFGELTRYPLSVAEKDGTLKAVASVYSANNDAIYDGLSRKGVRIVTFAPILKHGIFPLPRVLMRLLELGSGAMGCPLEMEFAANLPARRGEPGEFCVLQSRPLVVSREAEELEITETDPGELLCRSSKVLGVGVIDDIRDIVAVDPETFRRSASREAAVEVGRFNARLTVERRPYLLIGVGRWGSADPLLGIPVTWDKISGVRVIVEVGFQDIVVTPSQGAHFFQNLTAFGIGYFTVNPDLGEGLLDWDWLRGRREVDRGRYFRHLRFETPVVVRINGRRGEGVIVKPKS